MYIYIEYKEHIYIYINNKNISSIDLDDLYSIYIYILYYMDPVWRIIAIKTVQKRLIGTGFPNQIQGILLPKLFLRDASTD